MRFEETVISREDLKALGEYSCSLPTGVVVGKRWRRNLNAYRFDLKGAEPVWMIGEYVESEDDPEIIKIKWTWAVAAPGEPHRSRF